MLREFGAVAPETTVVWQDVGFGCLGDTNSARLVHGLKAMCKRQSSNSENRLSCVGCQLVSLGWYTHQPAWSAASGSACVLFMFFLSWSAASKPAWNQSSGSENRCGVVGCGLHRFFLYIQVNRQIQYFQNRNKTIHPFGFGLRTEVVEFVDVFPSVYCLHNYD